MTCEWLHNNTYSHIPTLAEVRIVSITKYVAQNEQKGAHSLLVISHAQRYTSSLVPIETDQK